MTDDALVKILADAEIGKDTALQWLHTESDAATIERLYRVARAALPWHRLALLLYVPVGLAVLLAMTVWAALTHHINEHALILLELFLFFIVLACVSILNLWHLRKGRFAALFLAERGDARVLSLLLAEWQIDPPLARRIWNNRVALQITNLLDSEKPLPTVHDDLNKLREIAIKLLQSEAVHYKRALTETEMYLALAVMRHLYHSRDIESRQLLKRLAHDPRPAAGQERNLVAETARHLLDAEKKPLASAEATATYQKSQAPAPVPLPTVLAAPEAQILHRS